jgi:hypothetical protein
MAIRSPKQMNLCPLPRYTAAVVQRLGYRVGADYSLDRSTARIANSGFGTEVKVQLALLSLLAMVAVAPLSGQDSPDFSGTWALESAPVGEPDVPQTMSVSQVLVTTNVRGEPMRPFFKELTITRIIANGALSETHQIGVVGGSISGRVGGAEGPRTQHRVVWEGQSLVFELGTFTGV